MPFVHRQMQYIAPLSLGLALMGGCAASECLRIPASGKVPETGVARCGEAVRADLDRQDLLDRYVALLRLRGDHKKIESVARQVLARDPMRTDARYFLAFALRKQRRTKDALAAYRAYVDSRKTDPDPHYGIALCHEASGDVVAAIASYEKYLELEKRSAREDWRARARARIAALRGGGPVPRKPRSSAGAPAPKPPGPKAAPQRRRAAPPRRTDCRAEEQKIAQDPFSHDAYEGFAVCAAALGKHAEVQRRMRIALRDNPDFARGWLHLGRAQRALGDAGAAKAAFAKDCAAGVSEACGQ